MVANDLFFEFEIIWLRPAAKELRYVREGTLMTGRRNVINVKKNRIKIVAYATLKPDTPNCGFRGKFRHRIWYLASHDPYSDEPYNKYNFPREAVFPSSIEPGKPSKKLWDARTK